MNKPQFFTIINGPLEAKFCSLGASLVSLKYGARELLLTPDSEEDFIADRHAYFGRIIYPFAGRTRLPIYQDGKELDLIPNEDQVMGHGGILSSAFMDWAGEQQGNLVRFSLSFDSPFKARIEVRYELTETSLLLRVDADPCGLSKSAFAFHPYFNLGLESALPLRLTIASEIVAAYDPETLLPLRFEKPSEELDFSMGKAVGEDIEKGILPTARLRGYDHCYLVNGKPCAKLESAELTIEVFSSLPCLQVYSANWPSPLLRGNKGLSYAGIAIEPMSIPMALSKDKVGSLHETIEYRFTVK